MRAGIAHVEVAGPLAAVAAAPQDKRHKGGTLAVQGQGLAGQRVAHKVPGPAGVKVIVAEQRVPEAQGLVGGSNVGFRPTEPSTQYSASLAMVLAAAQTRPSVASAS